jgi:ribosomal protein L37AE/L43A
MKKTDPLDKYFPEGRKAKVNSMGPARLRQAAGIQSERAREWFCPHCGAQEGYYFDRFLPMCYRCNKCGRDIDKTLAEEQAALDEYQTETEEQEEGIKYDEEKLRWSLLPWSSVEEILRVVEFGAKKYTPKNWQKVDPPNRYLDALLRHLVAHLEGEVNDEETGLTHLAHAGCNILFLIWLENQRRKESV